MGDQKVLIGGEIVFTLDAAGNFTFINREGRHLIGYQDDEARPINVLDVLPGLSAGEVRELAKRYFKQEFGSVFEIEITNRRGRRIPVEMSIDPVRRADGVLEFRGLAVREDIPQPPIRQRSVGRLFAVEFS